MTTVLFLLTGLLVGYVVYAFYTSDAGNVDDSAEPVVAPKPAAKQKPKPKPKAKPKAAKKAPKPAAKKTAEPVPEPEQYRNPANGETAAVPTNYRFAKRWIKEALVAEGLLDKIYKNNELDDAASKKVKTALDGFKKLKNYHA